MTKPNTLTSEVQTEGFDPRIDDLMRSHGLDPQVDSADDMLMQCVHEALQDKFDGDPRGVHHICAALRCYADTLEMINADEQKWLATIGMQLPTQKN